MIVAQCTIIIIILTREKISVNFTLPQLVVVLVFGVILPVLVQLVAELETYIQRITALYIQTTENRHRFFMPHLVKTHIVTIMEKT